MSDYMHSVSEALSQVMDDICVNETLVMKRRSAWLLNEILETIGYNINCKSIELKSYIFGSQTEGSTTFGLNSDKDTLCYSDSGSFIQNMSEWKQGNLNLMMIQNENISPGYCYLQLIRSDLPLPFTAYDEDDDTFMNMGTDSEGRLLLSRKVCTEVYGQYQQHGPAFVKPTEQGFIVTDNVISFYCKSAPHQVTSWLQKQRGGKWPTEDVLEECRNAGCFVVAVGSKVHSPDILESELDWRISTSLQERHLMFSLNMTQLMCYILMKMILKTHINQLVEDVWSSFMCKNVLLYCIANSSHDWHSGNLLSYLHLCLFMIKERVVQRNCPHFIIAENNLLAGRMTEEQRGRLLDIIDNLMEDDEQLLFEIQIDDLGKRLKMKLNMTPYSPTIAPAKVISLDISYTLVTSTAWNQSRCFKMFLKEIKHESLERVHQYLSQICSMLEIYRNEGGIQLSACELIKPLVCSTLGSVIACIDINSHKPVSEEAFFYLEAGKESDPLSGRLKLVSVLYCTGDMERAEWELTIIQTQYNLSEVHTICGCYFKPLSGVKLEGLDTIEYYNEKAIKSHVALCTRFLESEINCIPQELRYELLRSYIEEDRQMRTVQDSRWMDLIDVDSIPYLYFLRYKTYGHLQRRQEQEEALIRMTQSINLEPNLSHKESALNIVGQCQEQENRQSVALLCYIDSLKNRERNNAARFLLCIQLSRLILYSQLSKLSKIIHHEHICLILVQSGIWN